MCEVRDCSKDVARPHSRATCHSCGSSLPLPQNAVIGVERHSRYPWLASVLHCKSPVLVAVEGFQSDTLSPVRLYGQFT